MAEAQGQAAAQPELPQSYNPHEAVAHFTAMLEKSEQPEAPRDEKGKFVAKNEAKTETQTEEAKPATEATKEAVEEAPTEPAQEETKPEVRRFKLNYKGEEKEVDEPEAVELAQKGYDYTQKTQALAKEREELQAKIKTEADNNRKQYEQQLEVFRQQTLRLADPEVLNTDLEKLSMEDPAKALQISLKRQKLISSLEAIHGEQQRLAHQRAEEGRVAKQKETVEALEVIQRDVKGWGPELYGKILKTAEEIGYTKQEANAITDPKVVKLLNDARQWREYVAAKPNMDKRVAAVPKVQKPGAGERNDAKTDKYKDGMARLSKSGDRRDAQAAVLALLESGNL